LQVKSNTYFFAYISYECHIHEYLAAIVVGFASVFIN